MPHPCLFCQQSEAVITGLCHPCYYHLRYIHIRQLKGLAAEEKETEKDDKMAKHCPECDSPLHIDGKTRMRTTSCKKYAYHDVYVCRKCGYSITTRQ